MRSVTTLFETGDALRGDRVAINARRIDQLRVIQGSGRHRTQETIARDNVYCVIEMPLKARPRVQNRG